MAKYICPICKNVVDEEYKTYKNRRYHISCYKEMVDSLYKKEEENKPDKEKLIEYIYKCYNINELTGMMSAQLKNYIEEKEYKYIGMLYTLKYYFETLENVRNENIKGLGIIPMYYDEAKEFFKLKKDLQQKNNYIDYKTKKIEISKKDYSLSNKKIDISEV